MKLLALGLFFIFDLNSILLADDSPPANQITDVKHQLEAFDQGKVTLDEITIDRDAAWGSELLTYFVNHTNEVTVKMKLPISRWFAAYGKFPEAATYAQEYVNVYSNDWHGWKILGGANVIMENFSAAVHAYTNAVNFGDDGSCAQLAFTSMKINKDNIVSNMVPHLMMLKNSPLKKNIRPLEIAAMLVVYSTRNNQKDVFVKALEGVDPKEILKHDDFTTFVKQGCAQFKGPDIDKIRQEMDSAGISTNSVSNPSH